MTDVGKPGAGKGGWPGRRNNWSLWLLVIPFIATLIPTFYNSVSPALGGLPFFDWYLLMWVVVTAGIMAVVYVLRRDIPLERGSS